MKIERINQDKIRIFLTFDDLSERGIKREELWREMYKLHELFAEMMDQAYTELGFDAAGPLAVEVFTMPAHGMIVVVTRTHWNSLSHQHVVSIDEVELTDVFEMKVTLEESDTIVFTFHDFEDFIGAAHIANYLGISGALYQYDGQWIFHAEPINVDPQRLQALIAIMAEYGEATSVTAAVLDEYGKCIIAENAIAITCTHFKPRRA